MCDIQAPSLTSHCLSLIVYNTYVQIADYFQSGGTSPDEFAVGLHDEFKPLNEHDIGEFPGLGSEKQIEKSLDFQLTT